MALWIRENKERINKSSTIIIISIILLTAVNLYYRHWTFELPNYPNCDETITINNVKTLINGGQVYAYNYPHLGFYFGFLWYKLCSCFLEISDLVLFLRCAICGFALISNLCIYWGIKKITHSRFWGVIGFAIAVFSLYQMEYLYYCGPDVMLYGVSNFVYLVGILIYFETDEKTVLYKLYPVIAVTIGLAASAKYHGILLGSYWLCLHLAKKYHKSLKANLAFIGNCVIILIAFLAVNYQVLFHFDKFLEGFLFNFQNYSGMTYNSVNPAYNLPIWGYLAPFLFSAFGIIGAGCIVVGMIYFLLRKEKRSLLFSFFAPCLVVFIMLCRYYCVLARNISLIMPVAHLLLTVGLFAISIPVKYRCRHGQWVAGAIAAGLIIVNIGAICYSISYSVSYDVAEKWIVDNIEEGATIYIEYGYAPIIDRTKYNVVEVGNPLEFDVSVMQPGQYYIANSYRSLRYTQRLDYILWKGEYARPDWAETYLANIAKMTEVQTFESISDGRGWRYKINYENFFMYPRSDYYQGATIKVYVMQ